jgi:BirA family biotin operon repressor/biotin-[acetyl-CoA-carboxylase] ligase
VKPALHLPETTSTNDAAKKWAQEGAPDGAVIVADHQTAGRGRLGRSWHSPPGVNLYLSRIYRNSFDLLPLQGALATREAIQSYLPSDLTAAIKWPNDILVGEYKVAGILCELLEDAAIIGIGINVNTTGFPGDLRRPASSLRILTGAEQDREAVLKSILERLDYWKSNSGETVDVFTRHCITLGRRVKVSVPGREVLKGIAVRLNEKGALIVEDQANVAHCIEAGDVDTLE